METKRNKGYILIVDDEPTWRDFSHSTLSQEGYRVETAGAMSDALNMLQRDGYDVVVISSGLLEPEKREILDTLIAYCKNKGLVVMSEPVLSRSRHLAESRRAFQMGADWISKPLGRKSLLDFVNSLFMGYPKTPERIRS